MNNFFCEFLKNLVNVFVAVVIGLVLGGLICRNYVDFHYQPENDAGLVVKFRDKKSPFATKTFIIRIEDAANKEVVKEEI